MVSGRQVFIACCLVFCVLACANASVDPLPLSAANRPTAKIAKDSMSVSGISSGGCMATQMHVAYSSVFMGAGIISGAPYWCTSEESMSGIIPTGLSTHSFGAQSDVAVALSSCMKYPDLISTPVLTSAVQYAFATGTIDNPVYLKRAKVFIFHGTLDDELVLGVAEKMSDFYSHYVPTSQTYMNLSVPAAHSFVTKNYGNPCSFFGEPYMNNCGYDTAGNVLQWIYGPLNPPTTANLSNVISIDQSSFVPFPFSAASISMAKLGYAYIPSRCHNTDNTCRLHVALHGCLQNIDSIGFAFVHHAGYNEWAEANSIIVLYPQTIASPTVPYNPKACWDWWGYTGPEYASQLAPQMQVIQGMMKTFTIV